MGDVVNLNSGVISPSTQELQDNLWVVIEDHTDRHNMTLAELVGILEIIKSDLINATGYEYE